MTGLIQLSEERDSSKVLFINAGSATRNFAAKILQLIYLHGFIINYFAETACLFINKLIYK